MQYLFFKQGLAETKIHKGIYQYLTPLILNEVVKNINGRQAIYSTYDLVKATHIANHNYSGMKHSQSKVSKSLDIPLDTISEYFNKTDGYIDNYIRQCLNYLKSMSCIIYNEIYIIKTLQSKASGDLHGVKIEVVSNIHKATEQEMKLYTQLMEQADKAAGITSNQQRFYGKTAEIYQGTLSKLLKENDIAFIYKAFEIFCVHPDRCKQIAQTFSDKPLEQYKREIGAVMKMR